MTQNRPGFYIFVTTRQHTQITFDFKRAHRMWPYSLRPSRKGHGVHAVPSF